jgi:hypothetical protein
VHISHQLSRSDYLQAGTPELLEGLNKTETPKLHLSVSVRSFRAGAVSDFMGAIIDGNAERAQSIGGKLHHYPIVITRELEEARQWLRHQARGSERTGLVASSNGLRRKPAGLHIRAKIDPAVWFLGAKNDVRSSYALKDVATEFDVQGLELDWVGVCWNANFRWSEGQWSCFNLRGTRWEKVNDLARVAYLKNSYRVLLTRARQGMVIFVPRGSDIDHRRGHGCHDTTAEFLTSCGVVTLSS